MNVKGTYGAINMWQITWSLSVNHANTNKWKWNIFLIENIFIWYCCQMGSVKHIWYETMLNFPRIGKKNWNVFNSVTVHIHIYLSIFIDVMCIWNVYIRCIFQLISIFSVYFSVFFCNFLWLWLKTCLLFLRNSFAVLILQFLQLCKKIHITFLFVLYQSN